MTTPLTGAADTADAGELVSSVRPDDSRGATVSIGRVPGGPRTEWLDSDRTETYEQVGPDGRLITVQRNIELGETRIINREA
ncbi:MAG TPA: hypothetical protein VF635_00870 [Propionibacteriaceae bacterium]